MGRADATATAAAHKGDWREGGKGDSRRGGALRCEMARTR